MAYSIMKQNGTTQAHLLEYVVDTEEEVSELPVYPEIAIGSTALVIAGAKVKILANNNTWVDLV